MDDKFKQDLVEVIDQQFEQKFVKLFNKGFTEVIEPVLEEMSTDIKNLQRDVTSLKTGQDKMQKQFG